MPEQEGTFKFEVGAKVKILQGIRSDSIGEIEEREMSTGKVSIPCYMVRGYWYYEDEIEESESK